MSDIHAATTACKHLCEAMNNGDCAKVELVLNTQVRNPNREAKSYIRGYWNCGVRTMKGTDEHGPAALLHTPVGGWRCYRIDSAN